MRNHRAGRGGNTGRGEGEPQGGERGNHREGREGTTGREEGEPQGGARGNHRERRGGSTGREEVEPNEKYKDGPDIKQCLGAVNINLTPSKHLFLLLVLLLLCHQKDQGKKLR